MMSGVSEVIYVHELPVTDPGCPLEGWWHCDAGAGGEGVGAYVRVDALPNQIDIHRAVKASGARKHADIAQVVADLYTLEEGQGDA